MTPAETITGEAGLFVLGAGAIIAARGVALAAIAAGREAVAAAREAVEKNWVRGGFTVATPDQRFLKPSPKAAAAPEPVSEPAAGPVPISEKRGAA